MRGVTRKFLVEGMFRAGKTPPAAVRVSRRPRPLQLGDAHSSAMNPPQHTCRSASNRVPGPDGRHRPGPTRGQRAAGDAPSIMTTIVGLGQTLQPPVNDHHLCTSTASATNLRFEDVWLEGRVLVRHDRRLTSEGLPRLIRGGTVIQDRILSGRPSGAHCNIAVLITAAPRRRCGADLRPGSPVRTIVTVGVMNLPCRSYKKAESSPLKPVECADNGPRRVCNSSGKRWGAPCCSASTSLRCRNRTGRYSSSRFAAATNWRCMRSMREPSHRLHLTMRITANRETAEELTIDVFHDVWRRASSYDAGTVRAWLDHEPGTLASDRPNCAFESRKKRNDGGDVQPEAEPAADPRDVLELREQGEALRAALAALTADERQQSKRRSSAASRMPKLRCG